MARAEIIRSHAQPHIAHKHTLLEGPTVVAMYMDRNEQIQQLLTECTVYRLRRLRRDNANESEYSTK